MLRADIKKFYKKVYRPQTHPPTETHTHTQTYRHTDTQTHTHTPRAVFFSINVNLIVHNNLKLRLVIQQYHWLIIKI